MSGRVGGHFTQQLILFHNTLCCLLISHPFPHHSIISPPPPPLPVFERLWTERPENTWLVHNVRTVFAALSQVPDEAQVWHHLGVLVINLILLLLSLQYHILINLLLSVCCCQTAPIPVHVNCAVFLSDVVSLPTILIFPLVYQGVGHTIPKCVCGGFGACCEAIPGGGGHSPSAYWRLAYLVTAVVLL